LGVLEALGLMAEVVHRQALVLAVAVLHSQEAGIVATAQTVEQAAMALPLR
jgi:hypothetical protein